MVRRRRGVRNLMTTDEVLRAPHVLEYAYTRSVGPVIGRFFAGLRDGRIEGIRGARGQVIVPPVEYDPQTAEELSEFVEVGDSGVVTSWTGTDRPLDGQPLERPFAWALIRLDGADTPMLHAVDAGSADRMRTGMRVRVRWADRPTGHIRDITCFEPLGTPHNPTVLDPVAPVTAIVTPIHLRYEHSASPEESRYLRGLATGRLLGQRCPACGKVYIPPRGACPTDGVPTAEEVELPDRGIVTTFCVVNVPFPGQRVKPPYVTASVVLDGADIPFSHLILGCPAGEVRMGMRVRATWKLREQWGTTLENIDHFRPTGEPDAPFADYARHL